MKNKAFCDKIIIMGATWFRRRYQNFRAHVEDVASLVNPAANLIVANDDYVLAEANA